MENLSIFDNLCANQKAKPTYEKVRKYSFYEMLEEFELGYNGSFIINIFDNMIINYDREDKILLAETEEHIRPLTITTKLLSSEFIKRKIYVTNIEAFEMINSGKLVNFDCTFDEGIQYSGWYLIKDNNDKYYLSIKDNDFSDSWLILNALIRGKWYL